MYGIDIVGCQNLIWNHCRNSSDFFASHFKRCVFIGKLYKDLKLTFFGCCPVADLLDGQFLPISCTKLKILLLLTGRASIQLRIGSFSYPNPSFKEWGKRIWRIQPGLMHISNLLCSWDIHLKNIVKIVMRLTFFVRQIISNPKSFQKSQCPKVSYLKKRFLL